MHFQADLVLCSLIDGCCQCGPVCRPSWSSVSQPVLRWLWPMFYPRTPVGREPAARAGRIILRMQFPYANRSLLRCLWPPASSAILHGH